MIALVYLLCVLAPTVSFALPGGQDIAHCLTGENLPPRVVHMHDEGTMRLHQDGHHHHAGAGMQTEPSVADVVNAATLKSDFSPAKAPHAMDGKCCGLMCAVALPATFVAVVRPSMPKAVRVSDSYRELTDNAPAVRYRPPIS